MGQLRRFTVQNGKVHGVGVIGARLKLAFVLNCLSINITLAVLGKFDHNWLCQQVVPRMCLGFRQAVCTGFQICEHTGDFAVALRCGGNGTCVFVIELIVSIYLRFSSGCCFDQLFQLELNITQGHFLVLIIAFRVLLDDIQYKLRVLQRVGQHNRAAVAGDGSTIDCGCGVLCAISIADFCFRFSLYNIRIAFNRNGSVFRGKVAFIVHRTFHNAVLVVRMIRNVKLVQVRKGTVPALAGRGYRYIFQAVVCVLILHRLPSFAFRLAALELDINFIRQAIFQRVTICVHPRFGKVDLDQFMHRVRECRGNIRSTSTD